MTCANYLKLPAYSSKVNSLGFLAHIFIETVNRKTLKKCLLNFFCLFVSGEDEREALICHNRRTRIIPLIIASDIAVQQVLNCEIVIIRVGVGGVDKRLAG